MATEETVLRALRDALKTRKTEAGERAAIAATLARYGYTELPAVEEGRTPEGKAIRIYSYFGTPAGDFMFIGGPSLVGEIQKITDKMMTDAPRGAFIQTNVAGKARTKAMTGNMASAAGRVTALAHEVTEAFKPPPAPKAPPAIRKPSAPRKPKPPPAVAAPAPVAALPPPPPPPPPPAEPAMSAAEMTAEITAAIQAAMRGMKSNPRSVKAIVPEAIYDSPDTETASDIYRISRLVARRAVADLQAHGFEASWAPDHDDRFLAWLYVTRAAKSNPAMEGQVYGDTMAYEPSDYDPGPDPRESLKERLEEIAWHAADAHAESREVEAAGGPSPDDVYSFDLWGMLAEENIPTTQKNIDALRDALRRALREEKRHWDVMHEDEDDE